MHRAGMAPLDLTLWLRSSSKRPFLFSLYIAAKKVCFGRWLLPALPAEHKSRTTETQGEVGIKKKGENTCIINVITTTTYNNAKHQYSLYTISRN